MVVAVAVAVAVAAADGDSPQQNMSKNEQNGHHRVPDFGYSPNPWRECLNQILKFAVDVCGLVQKGTSQNMNQSLDHLNLSLVDKLHPDDHNQFLNLLLLLLY
ncbi:Hypothetical predicted protein [Olea europaea subsp. europaea]|uniref:Uncharacterized protein n=1 Tax=Olea europaea subsp. europaea TaxID=158383 RepID=A0A8S0T0E9_OLEEU|nr:Hypothetical predicted protein [Olea europaea subsp. europaea]